MIDDYAIQPPTKPLSPVRDTAIYPRQVSILLAQRLQGKSLFEGAVLLGVSPELLHKVLRGQWNPTASICKQLGLKPAYVLSE